MEYHGRLFGKVGNKYFDTGSTSDDFDNLQKRVAELEAQIEKISNVEIRESDDSLCVICNERPPVYPLWACKECTIAYNREKQREKERT